MLKAHTGDELQNSSHQNLVGPKPWLKYGPLYSLLYAPVSTLFDTARILHVVSATSALVSVPGASGRS